MKIDFEDRANLPVVEHALLWAIRAWVIGLTRRLPVEEKIEEVLGRLGAPEAAGSLFGLMWVIGHGATRTIAVDCVCHPRVSEDERTLLDVLALYQQSRSFEALVLLRSMLTANAAVAAGGSASHLARRLAAAGRHLTLAPRETTRHVFAAQATPTFH